MITQKCSVSGKEFVITDEDLAFYKKMGVPAPTLCPEERQRRRLAWRNEKSLYWRECDVTKKKILSIYGPQSVFPVYEKDYWWSDEWDARNYGKDFDFSRPFFEQFRELQKVVPRMSLHVIGNENCNYVNQCGLSKDCYMCFNADYSDSCINCDNVLRANSCLDCFQIQDSELCYETLYSKKCYSCSYLLNCSKCSDSFFLKNCRNCKNCFGCVNLENKSYWLFNRPCSKEVYEKRLLALGISSSENLDKIRYQFIDFLEGVPHRFAEIFQSEDCSGNYIRNSKNVMDSFDCYESEDSKFCTTFSEGKDCYDFDIGGYKSELCYEIISSGDRNYRCRLMPNGWSNTSYCDYCDVVSNAKNCFGCISLVGAEYCILNKQYTKDEYEALVPRIIEHMKKTKEWGEFFPIEMSPFGYNETLAQEYYPLTKREVLAKNYKWTEETTSAKYDGPKYKIPHDIKDVKDDILQAILTCEKTGKNYRIVKPELDFYRKMNLPIPRLCPEERHRQRMELRNPRKLWDRECDECTSAIQTTYSPERPEKVLCEECYLKEVQ